MVEDRIDVRGENFGELLIQSLEEAVEVEKGGLQPARFRRRKVTARQVRVSPPPGYSAARITGCATSRVLRSRSLRVCSV
jgi:hypothetical protein